MKTDDQSPHYEQLHVGIFWSVGDDIIGAAVPLESAEPYGDALQHGGHYEFWENHRPNTLKARQFLSHAYDYFPRGRMVFFPRANSATLYIDRCMDRPAIDRALAFFHATGFPVRIETDEHYRCAACNPYFME